MFGKAHTEPRGNVIQEKTVSPPAKKNQSGGECVLL
jgi:hypothetical protein